MTAETISPPVLLVARTGSLGFAGEAAQAQKAPPFPPPAPAPITALPSTDLVPIGEGCNAVPYDLANVVPTGVTTPDGEAWCSFSACPRVSGGADVIRVFAARLEPRIGVWLPGAALSVKTYQFGPATLIDDTGVVHVVYEDGDSDAPQARWSTSATTAVDVRRRAESPRFESPLPGDAFPCPRQGWRHPPPLARPALGLARAPPLDENNGDVFASELVDRDS